MCKSSCPNGYDIDCDYHCGMPTKCQEDRRCVMHLKPDDVMKTCLFYLPDDIYEETAHNHSYGHCIIARYGGYCPVKELNLSERHYLKSCETCGWYVKNKCKCPGKDSPRKVRKFSAFCESRDQKFWKSKKDVEFQ